MSEPNSAVHYMIRLESHLSNKSLLLSSLHVQDSLNKFGMFCPNSILQSRIGVHKHPIHIFHGELRTSRSLSFHGDGSRDGYLLPGEKSYSH